MADLLDPAAERYVTISLFLMLLGCGRTLILPCVVGGRNGLPTKAGRIVPPVRTPLFLPSVVTISLFLMLLGCGRALPAPAGPSVTIISAMADLLEPAAERSALILPCVVGGRNGLPAKAGRIVPPVRTPLFLPSVVTISLFLMLLCSGRMLIPALAAARPAAAAAADSNAPAAARSAAATTAASLIADVVGLTRKR